MHTLHCACNNTDNGSDWGVGGSSSSGGGGAGGGGGPLPDVNPMEALKRELGMQSNKLDPDIKERVEAAIARLGYRVTVGQVSSSRRSCRSRGLSLLCV